MCLDGDDFSVSGDSAQEIAPIASDESNGKNVTDLHHITLVTDLVLL